MPKMPIVTGKEMIKFLNKLGFSTIRINGSHHRMKSKDGRITTIPVHANRTLPRGLLRKIIRDDLEITLNDFSILYTELQKPGKKTGGNPDE